MIFQVHLDSTGFETDHLDSTGFGADKTHWPIVLFGTETVNGIGFL